MAEPLKTPMADYIKLSRRDYEIILNWARGIDDLDSEEQSVKLKVEQILINIKKFNEARRQAEVR